MPARNLEADFHECGGNNVSEWREPPKGGTYYGKTMAEVVLEHQGNPRTSFTDLGPGKIFSLFWKSLWGLGVCVLSSADKEDGREIP